MLVSLETHFATEERESDTGKEGRGNWGFSFAFFTNVVLVVFPLCVFLLLGLTLSETSLDATNRR
jgi:hypothetical protein